MTNVLSQGLPCGSRPARYIFCFPGMLLLCISLAYGVPSSKGNTSDVLVNYEELALHSFYVNNIANNIHFLENPAEADETLTRSDTLVLEEIRVLGSRIERPDHHHPVLVQHIDSREVQNLRHTSASELINAHTHGIARDYGAGNMSLISQRGFSPSQTRLMWEDLPLNHPMLGVFDMSLIPAGLLDGISASSGNPAAMSGSGGIAGTVSLRTTSSPDRFFLSHATGSFGVMQTGAGAAVSQGPFEGEVRAYQHSGDFDFRYNDPFQNERKTRDNNARSAGYLLARGSYRTGEWHFRSLLWMDDISNELPGPTTGPAPARQDDRSVRWIIQSGFDGFERTQLTATTAVYRYDLDYTPRRTGRTDASTTDLLLFKPTARHVWSPAHETWISLQWAYQTVQSDNYSALETHRSLSGRLNHEWSPLRWLNIHPSLEWEYHTEFQYSANPAVGLTVRPFGDAVSFRSMISRNRNVPGYNDLHWKPGGNPDLKPEMVNSLEVGVSGRTGDPDSDHEFASMGFGITGFHHDFDDGIRWVPGQEGFATPVNIDRLRSRGVEGELSAKVRHSGFRLKTRYMFSYTRATIEEQRFEGDQSVGKQMMYVPDWVHKGWIRAEFSSYLWMRFTFQHVAQRHTTSDHSGPFDPLDAFTNMDVDLGTSIPFGLAGMDLGFGVQNLGDSRHQFILGYPVPPRHYRFSISISIS